MMEDMPTEPTSPEANEHAIRAAKHNLESAEGAASLALTHLQSAVLEAINAGASWEWIAQVLDVSKQSAWRRFRDPSTMPDEPPTEA